MRNLTILLFSILLSFSSFSQTPQAFKYQAVVRDNLGEIITNQEVSFRIAIRESVPTGTILYQETHTEFTNDFGVVILKIGTGTPESGSWSNIDWGTNDKYMELALDPVGGTSYTSLGTTQLLAVPYALYSENSGAAGNTLDQAYDEGGAGIGRTITADAGAFRVAGVDGALFTGTGGSGSIPTEGGGTRMMWYPRKAAFRAGRTFGAQWDDVYIGEYSFATGMSTLAYGFGSTAQGYYSTAGGDYSTAIGNNTNAGGASSTALGYSTNASGASSTAIGNSTNAGGASSTALGYSTTASGNTSTAMGAGTIASGLYSTAMGFAIEAAGDYSIAIGLNDQLGTSVTQNSTMAIMGGKVGVGTTSPSATFEVNATDGVMFTGTPGVGILPASGSGTRVIWYPRKAAFRAGYVSSTQWDDANIGVYSLATGANTNASGSYSTALGRTTTASGTHTTALGYRTIAQSYNSLAFGRYNADNGTPGSWENTELVLSIGDGTSTSALSNSLTFSKNGYMWIQGTITQNSDKNLKSDIQLLSNALQNIQKINGVSYKWLDTDQMGKQTEIGVIAQEVEKVYPELVGENEGYKTTNYIGLVPVLIEAVKEQQELINNLEQRISELEKQ